MHVVELEVCHPSLDEVLLIGVPVAVDVGLLEKAVLQGHGERQDTRSHRLKGQSITAAVLRINGPDIRRRLKVGNLKTEPKKKGQDTSSIVDTI